MSGPISDDENPTHADVRVYLSRQEPRRLSVRFYEDVGVTVENEITNKIVEAIVDWARDFNERNHVGYGAGRHCRTIWLNASISIEE